MGLSGTPDDIREQLQAEKDRLLRDPAYFSEWWTFLHDCDSLDMPKYMHVTYSDDPDDAS